MKNIKTFEFFSKNSLDENLKLLEKEIIKALNAKKLDFKIEIFHSGYDGILIKIKGYKKFYIFDQEGKLGLEDQTMPFILLEYDNKEIIKYEPDYFTRKFGDVKMKKSMRKESYKRIIDFFHNLPKPERVIENNIY